VVAVRSAAFTSSLASMLNPDSVERCVPGFVQFGGSFRDPRHIASGDPRSRLDRALDAELAHAGLESGALDAENGSGTAGAGDAPLGLFENLDDVLALSVI
jgi:hypothetical protein